MLTEKEMRILHETHHRNLLRYLKQLYSKIKEHPELTEEARELTTEIKELEKELQ